MKLRLAALVSMFTVALAPAADDRDDRLGAGGRAWQEGRFEAALAALREAESVAGAKASPELLYDVALAAARTGDLSLAASAAARAASAGDPAVAELAAFLEGNLRFARSEFAERGEESVEPTVVALDQAIVEMEAAKAAWQRVAVQRGDWPAARRNVERAVLRLEELRRRRAAAIQRTPAPTPDPQPTAEPPPEADAPASEAPQEAAIEPSLEPLSAARIAELAEKLAAVEKAKLAVRRARRRQQPPEVERDW